jgi:type IV pilus biogenesis protein CpaD/CtpE
MKLKRTPRRIALLLAATTALVAGAVGGAFAIAGDDDATERPIPSADLEQAKDAALAETGGGRVTATEVDDEESKYEVEVTLDNGTQVDVQLDRNFNVVGTDSDGRDDESGNDESGDD